MEIQAKTRSFRQPSFPVLFQTPLRDSTLMIKLKPSICKLHYGACVGAPSFCLQTSFHAPDSNNFHPLVSSRAHDTPSIALAARHSPLRSEVVRQSTVTVTVTATVTVCRPREPATLGPTHRTHLRPAILGFSVRTGSPTLSHPSHPYSGPLSRLSLRLSCMGFPHLWAWHHDYRP